MLPVLGCVLDHTQFERAEQFERQTILEGFLAKEHITLEEVLRDRILRCSNHGEFDLLVFLTGHHHRTEGAQVDADVEDVVCHMGVP